MPGVRSSRLKASKSSQKLTIRSAKASKSKQQQKGKTASNSGAPEDSDFNESSSEDGGDVYVDSASAREGEDEDDVRSMDSDALDDDETTGNSRKRKRASPAKKVSSKKSSLRKKGNDEDDEDDFELKEGQEIVGVIVQAPKTGRGTWLRLPDAFSRSLPELWAPFSTCRSNIAEHVRLLDSAEGPKI